MYIIVALLVVLVVALTYALVNVTKSRNQLRQNIARFRLDGYILDKGPSSVGNYLPDLIVKELSRRGINRNTGRGATGTIIAIEAVTKTTSGLSCRYRVHAPGGSLDVRSCTSTGPGRTDHANYRYGELAYLVATQIVDQVGEEPLK